jgi:cysteine desulfurase
MRHVYFDHQSATPVLPEVFEAMRPFFSEAFGNPGSLHRYGVQARDALAKARAQVAGLIHAEWDEEIIFTSGATEAANLAVKGVAYASQRRGRHLVASAIEHPAVLTSLEFLETQGFACTRVPVGPEGLVDPAAVRAALTEHTTLICVQHVNHEIGTIQPMREIAELADERGIPLFVDASAGGGWLPVDVQALGASLLSLAPHRFYGPKGAGVLYRSRRARLASLIHGGTQEGGRRAGTENVPAIVGAGLAAEIAQRELAQRMANTARLQKQLWEGLHAQVPYVQLNGPPPGPQRLGANLNFSTEFVEGEGLALLCDVHGIAVASGSACVSKALKISPVLAAIGLAPSLAQANLLLSLGRENTGEDVTYFLETFPKLAAKLRGMSPIWEEFQQGAVASVIGSRLGSQASR